MIDNRVFIFSNFDENPDFFFQGYCFIEHDYIYGFEGAKNYEVVKKNRIDFNEDGCYVLMRKSGCNYLFGADYSGYKKIFYYHNPYEKIWIVSNSINLIVELMKEKGLKYTPNCAQINAMVLNKNFNQQLTSFKTPVNEITLLPANTYLSINDSYFSINECENTLLSHFNNYEEIIHKYFEIWTSRYLTLVKNEEFIINQDLTGGIDSRAIFSLTHLANDKVLNKRPNNQKLISRVSRGDKIDYDIAKEITGFYNYNLQSNIPNEDELLDVKESYDLWKHINLGSYHPIYFPVNNINPYIVKLNGAGGGNYSPYYSANAKNYSKHRFELYTGQFTKNFKYGFLGNEYKNNILESMQYISKQINNKSNEKLTLHYTKFRNRFHGGMIPQYTVCFTPLSSKYLDCVMAICSKDKIQSAQIMYDLINVTNELLLMPYDFVKKSPKSTNIENIFCLSRELNVKAGDIYISKLSQHIDENQLIDKNISCMEYIFKDFKLACQSEFVQEFWGSEFLYNTEKALVAAIKNNKFSHGRDGINVSAVITSGLF